MPKSARARKIPVPVGNPVIDHRNQTDGYAAPVTRRVNDTAPVKVRVDNYRIIRFIKSDCFNILMVIAQINNLKGGLTL